VEDDGAGFVVCDSDGARRVAAPIVGPANVAREHVLGSLQPLEADHGRSANFGIPGRDSRLCKDVDFLTGGSRGKPIESFVRLRNLPVHLGELRRVSCPPSGEPFHHLGLARLYAGIPFDQWTDGSTVQPRGREVEVGGILSPLRKYMGRIEADSLEQRALVHHLGRGHATKQMGAYVMRLRWRRVVDVAPDVEIEVVGRVCDFRDRDDAGVGGHVFVAVEGGDDLLDVLRAQVVLGPAGMELGVSIDEWAGSGRGNLLQANRTARRAAALSGLRSRPGCALQAGLAHLLHVPVQ
jgi:hypothetical protein